MARNTSHASVEQAEPFPVSMPSAFLHALAATTSRAEVLTSLASWLPLIIESDRSSVNQPINDSYLELVPIGPVTLPSGTLLPIEGSIAGHAYRTLEPVHLPDISRSVGFEIDALLADGVRSVFCCPLVHAGKSLGTVNLARCAPVPFNRHDRELVRSLADLVAAFLAAHHRADIERLRSLTDELTGAHSRSAILGLLEEHFERGATPSLLFLDVDKFKSLNDRYGHAFGDLVLREIADRLRVLVSPHGGQLGRFGGDES